LAIQVQIPYYGGYSFLNSFQLESVFLDAAKLMLNLVLNLKNTITRKQDQIKLSNINANTLTEKEKFYSNEKEINNLIELVLKECLDINIINNPRHMIELAEITSSRKETQYVTPIGDRVRQRIQEILTVSKERKKKDKELSELHKKKIKLWEKWETLSLEQDDRYNVLFYEKEMEKIKYPDYYFMTKDELEKLDLKIISFIIESIYDRRDIFEKKSCKSLNVRLKRKKNCRSKRGI